MSDSTTSADRQIHVRAAVEDSDEICLDGLIFLCHTGRKSPEQLSMQMLGAAMIFPLKYPMSPVWAELDFLQHFYWECAL